ncbi:MAG: ABC transporter ATP-binding protein [Phycisphaeraceae bacterium]|nr:ABC transporter ATP-binding protein [Phycisphaerales bacterium]MCB9842753.1 ABC transporter ATP-binding protein [Phycisphaeraceae bacterium]
MTTTHHPPTAASTAIIEARSVYKTYTLGKTKVPVLRGASIKVDAGECVAVLGASGSGKSTLLHLLGGLDRPDDRAVSDNDELTDGGRVYFRNEPISSFGPARLDQFRNQSVGFVFQFYHLLPELSIVENTMLGSMIGARKHSRAEMKARATELLERFGLAARLAHRPVELSGGERQRVAIARALMNQPDVLLADEPTGNLDRKTGAQILDALMELRERFKQTMVIVTHDAATADRADRIVRLRDGRVIGAGESLHSDDD